MFRPFLAAGLIAASAAQADPFTIVAYGDNPAGPPAEAYPPFEVLIETINATQPALAIHIGDVKAGATPCTDQLLAEQLDFLNAIEAPVLFTPGDNDWTDCHIEAAGSHDPIERLAHLRATWFTRPGQTFGATPLPVESQGGGYPENARMVLQDVMVMTAHVVGSNNNFEPRDLAAVQEFMARNDAAIAWLRDSFAAATEAGHAAMVVAIHANLFTSDFNTWNSTWAGHSGFGAFGRALKEVSAAFGKPVLLIYGDAHVFSQSRPFPTQAPNLMALQVPGAPQMHAVEITIDPQSSGVFAVSHLRNPALPG